MNKLLIAFLSISIVAIQASEKPFFDEPTKDVVKTSAKVSAGVSLVLGSAGHALKYLSGLPSSEKSLIPLKIPCEGPIFWHRDPFIRYAFSYEMAINQFAIIHQVVHKGLLPVFKHGCETDYNPNSKLKLYTANVAKGLISAGSVASAPLRSALLTPTIITPGLIETSCAVKGVIPGAVAFAVPVVYHKYNEWVNGYIKEDKHLEI